MMSILQELQDRTGNANFIVASANEIRSKQHPKLPEILPLAPASGHMSVEHVASNGHPPITPAPDVHPPPALTPSRSKSTAAAVSIPAHKATSANHESALASQSDALPETSSDPLANGHASPAEAAAVPLLFGNGLPPSFAVMPPPAPYVPNAQVSVVISAWPSMCQPLEASECTVTCELPVRSSIHYISCPRLYAGACGGGMSHVTESDNHYCLLRPCTWCPGPSA